MQQTLESFVNDEIALATTHARKREYLLGWEHSVNALRVQPSNCNAWIMVAFCMLKSKRLCFVYALHCAESTKTTEIHEREIRKLILKGSGSLKKYHEFQKKCLNEKTKLHAQLLNLMLQNEPESYLLSLLMLYGFRFNNALQSFSQITEGFARQEDCNYISQKTKCALNMTHLPPFSTMLAQEHRIDQHIVDCVNMISEHCSVSLHVAELALACSVRSAHQTDNEACVTTVDTELSSYLRNTSTSTIGCRGAEYLISYLACGRNSLAVKCGQQFQQEDQHYYEIFKAKGEIVDANLIPKMQEFMEAKEAMFYDIGLSFDDNYYHCMCILQIPSTCSNQQPLYRVLQAYAGKYSLYEWLTNFTIRPEFQNWMPFSQVVQCVALGLTSAMSASKQLVSICHRIAFGCDLPGPIRVDNNAEIHMEFKPISLSPITQRLEQVRDIAIASINYRRNFTDIKTNSTET